MAQKRMFSLSVVDTDKFLEMPVSARLLYYELGMRADDDGFVDNWKKILLFTGLKEDDVKILIAKDFIIPFESGIIVIKHWRMNNYLQNDRVKATTHQNELKSLKLDENNVYTLDTTCIHHKNDEPQKIPESTDVYTLDTTCIHSIDKNSIEENRLDEIRLEENNISSPAKQEQQFTQEFERMWLYYPNKKGKSKALKKYILARKKGVTYEEIAQGLKNYINYCKKNKIAEQYIKHGSSWFNQECWKDEYKTVDLKSNDSQMEILKGVHNGTIKIN